jgi:hypothetical protein
MTKQYSSLALWMMLLLVGAILVMVLYVFTSEIVTKYGGKQVFANVHEVPEQCGRRNSIKGKLEGDTYSLRISREECNRKTYEPGEPVVILYHRFFNKAIWPHENPQYTLLLLLGIIVAGLIYERSRATSRAKKRR